MRSEPQNKEMQEATWQVVLGASLSGLATGIVSLRRADYPAWALDALAARGVDLAESGPERGIAACTKRLCRSPKARRCGCASS